MCYRNRQEQWKSSNVYNFKLKYDIHLVHFLVCNTQWIFKMHGATIKINWQWFNMWNFTKYIPEIFHFHWTLFVYSDHWKFQVHSLLVKFHLLHFSHYILLTMPVIPLHVQAWQLTFEVFIHIVAFWVMAVWLGSRLTPFRKNIHKGS
jgi:hypothetical protein